MSEKDYDDVPGTYVENNTIEHSFDSYREIMKEKNPYSHLTCA